MTDSKHQDRCPIEFLLVLIGVAGPIAVAELLHQAPIPPMASVLLTFLAGVAIFFGVVMAYQTLPKRGDEYRPEQP